MNLKILGIMQSLIEEKMEDIGLQNIGKGVIICVYGKNKGVIW